MNKNTKTIKFPASIHSKESEYTELIHTLSPLLYIHEEKEFLLDFSQIEWLDANLLAIIGAAIEHGSQKCQIKYITQSINQEQADLWGRNGFGKYFSLETPKRYDTTVDYKVFASNNAKEFGDYIDNHLLNKRGFPHLSSALKKRISNNIQEIFGNAPLHGNCSKVISCGQYFHKSKNLIFTIVDYGTTISENVIKYFKYLGESVPDHCIRWATLENNSTKQMVNGKSGGMGLTLLKEFIKLNQGLLQICSGNEFWECTNKKEKSKKIETNFPGTIVSINIKMNDHKSYSLIDENINDLF